GYNRLSSSFLPSALSHALCYPGVTPGGGSDRRISRHGSKAGNSLVIGSGFSKTPASPMLVRGSQSHNQHGENRHELSGYVLHPSLAIRAHPRTGPCLLAGPATPAAAEAGAGHPGPRRGRVDLRAGSPALGQQESWLTTGRP